MNNSSMQDVANEIEEIETREMTMQTRMELRDQYETIIEILQKYVDLPQDYYPLIALWCIGTYVHEEFETYPLLFINAAKGSGKSRLLKLIAKLSWNGKIVLDLREAVLFRTAKEGTVCIDEFEGVAKKENGTLRTLINASYKKGAFVERIKTVVKNGKEERVVERFDLYTSVVMANIWGMEEVTADRCLNVPLERSNNPLKTKLVEDFDRNNEISQVINRLNELRCSLCSVVARKKVGEGWNNYIINKYTTTHTTYTTFKHIHTLTTSFQEEEFYSKIEKTGIDGRNLELFFPLYVIAETLGDEVLTSSLDLSKKVISDKKEEEFAENKDITLADFVSKQGGWRGSWKGIADITREFRMIAVEDPDEERWINPRWLSRALKRNKLVIQKRRLGKGVEVLLDIDKAKHLITMHGQVKE